MTFNYRNHKKITVIDGNIAYTGGFNLADEYANYIERFGHWKDSGIRLCGDGAYSFTCFFLDMWRIANGDVEINDADYKPLIHVEEAGYVQPFMGGPHRNPHNPIEGVYTRMINKARDYVYITTPSQKILQFLPVSFPDSPLLPLISYQSVYLHFSCILPYSAPPYGRIIATHL